MFRFAPLVSHCSKSAHFGKNISVTFSMTIWKLAADRKWSWEERGPLWGLVWLWTCFEYAKKVKVIQLSWVSKKSKFPYGHFLLIFNFCSGTVWVLICLTVIRQDRSVWRKSMQIYTAGGSSLSTEHCNKATSLHGLHWKVNVAHCRYCWFGHKYKIQSTTVEKSARLWKT